MGTWITSMFFTGFAQFCISCWYAHLFKFPYISLTPSGIPNEPCEGYTAASGATIRYYSDSVVDGGGQRSAVV